MIESEQNGKSVVRSERFERGVSLVASLITHCSGEQAEVRLVTIDDNGEFGIGSGHLHRCLRRLSVIEAEFKGTGDELAFFEELNEDFENSHIFVVSVAEHQNALPDLPSEAIVIEF